MRRSIRLAHGLVAAFFCLSATTALSEDNPLQNGASWTDLRALLLDGPDPAENAALLSLDAPPRAVDPAFVPIRLSQQPGTDALDHITLVVDENPAPVAAEITLGRAMFPLDMEVRLRVNEYSNVRAIGHAADAQVMSGRFVKAAGGCAAPASKSAEEALAELGLMRFEVLTRTEADAADRRRAKLMIRHPNATGFQRDQVTLLTVPAHFIDVLEVKQGDALLFRVEAGISISEDPVFQFSFADNGSETIRVHVEDTEGNIFDRDFPLTGL
ncbi:MAG: quinoprotein dehydrogenase-associated SoxYZ-like carrier [Paracoccaceae bacterium]